MFYYNVSADYLKLKMYLERYGGNMIIESEDKKSYINIEFVEKELLLWKV